MMMMKSVWKRDGKLWVVKQSRVYSLSLRFTVANDVVIKGHGNDTSRVRTGIYGCLMLAYERESEKVSLAA